MASKIDPIDAVIETASFRFKPSVCDLFEAQAKRTPEQNAVRWGGETLSYCELDRRANGLSHALRARGVRRGQLVGLYLERGFDMLITLLGILKAGGAYVPLDPSFPQERLRFMVEDAGLRLLVSTGALASTFGLAGAHTLLLDDPAPTMASQSGQRLTPDAALDA